LTTWLKSPTLQREKRYYGKTTSVFETKTIGLKMPVPSALVNAKSRLLRLTPSVIEAKLLELIRNTEHLAVDMNTSQLMDGVNSLGRPLAPYRSPSYAEFKRTLNPKGVTDLKLSGDFHRGFFTDADAFPVRFDSRDSKTGMLVEQYGQELFGLTRTNLNEYSDEIKRLYVIWFKNQILRLR